MAAQTFSRWSRLGAWERLLEAAQRRGGIEAGMAFLDGTGIRAHHKAAGAAKRGDPRRGATRVRHWAVRAAVPGPRPAGSPTPPAPPTALPRPPGRAPNCPWH